MKVSILSISAGNNISSKNKLTTNLCACEVPNFFIKNQVVSDTLLSDPMIQLSTPCGTSTTQTCAIVKSGTHLYFVKGLLPRAGNTYSMAGNTEVGFSDE